MSNVTQEPRWPAVTAFVAVGLLSLAHPPALTAGPRWLVVGSIGILLIPAMIAHKAGQHSFAHVLLTIANTLELQRLATELRDDVSVYGRRREEVRVVSPASLREMGIGRGSSTRRRSRCSGRPSPP